MVAGSDSVDVMDNAMRKILSLLPATLKRSAENGVVISRSLRKEDGTSVVRILAIFRWHGPLGYRRRWYLQASVDASSMSEWKLRSRQH